MDYIEVNFTVTPLDPWSDILISELGALGYESFASDDNGVKAYIPSTQFKEDVLTNLKLQVAGYTFDYSYKNIEDQNWNAEWEKYFDPIIVDDKVYLKASFHAERHDLEHTILIDPKMSFGTGHHATTYLMSKHIMNIDVDGKDVLDMGCGTAVLAILAKKKGARNVLAVDIDEWAYNNSVQNVKANDCAEIEVIQGDASVLDNRVFNVILANINLNILLNDMEAYLASLTDEGTILFSGVLQHDKEKLRAAAEDSGLIFEHEEVRDKWTVQQYTKRS